ncbi:FAD-dependent monooxygenase [Bradyrhizobium sp. ORS 111]|uniref:FAD-dependent monooxygenase n=1 Tax=Bradyrhizobium sp. ORS 111 TaxID=1685958 RepID=UPI00388D193B
MALTRTVVVAGAGIGGLTASLTLAAQGFRVVVLERAERLEEAGAGIQLSPNASRILVELGLRERLAPRAVTPESVNIMSTRAGGEIARMPLGEAAAARAGAPYWVVHRADLQAALQAAVDDHPEIDLRLGCQFEDVTEHAEGLTVVQRRGNARQQEQAAALIGADGIWSSVRRQLFPDLQPQFSGLIAWRGTLEASALPQEDAAPCVQLWMGPDAHLVVYPISAGRQINVVAIAAGAWNQPGWSAPGDSNEINGVFAKSRWPSVAQTLVGAVDGWRKWALFTLPDIGGWNEGAVALLGDAAHAMLPFAAQGAGMAIEDAAVLAQTLRDSTGESRSDIPAALARYTQMRRARVLQVQRLARRQGRIYHLSGAAAIARDLAIRAMGPQRMLARQGWIYDWRV